MTSPHFKKEFNELLAIWVAETLRRYELLLGDDDLFAYVKHAEALINRSGKRLRPYLMALTHEACGGSVTPDIYRVGMILELFHNHALMHDDIVDRGEDRNDIITLHRFIEGELRRRGGIGDIKHIAEGQTIFVGDLILSWTGRLWDELKTFEPERARAGKRLFYNMVEEVMLGEIIDIDMMARERVSMELIEQKMRLKTASYSVIRPMQIGAALAGADNNILSFAEKFGLSLGIAFQIQDDLFDLTLTPDNKVKTVLSDVRTHQQTIFTQFIFDNGSEKNKKELLALLGSDLVEADRPRVLHLFKSSGALAYGEQKMNACFEKSLLTLEASPLPKKYKDEFRKLIFMIRQRTS